VLFPKRNRRLLQDVIFPVNCMIISHYERDGEIKIGNAAPEPPSGRELARRKRMQREG